MLLADFVHFLLQEEEAISLRTGCVEMQAGWLSALPATQIRSRLADNLAALEIAFAAWTDYLRAKGSMTGEFETVKAGYHGWLQAIGNDLSQMVVTESPAQIFVDTLNDLLEAERLVMQNVPPRPGSNQNDWQNSTGGSSRPVVGLHDPSPNIAWILLGTALGAVNQSLRQQERAPITISHRTLIQALVEAGFLATDQSNGTRTRQRRMPDGSRPRMLPLRGELFGYGGARANPQPPREPPRIFNDAG